MWTAYRILLSTHIKAGVVWVGRTCSTQEAMRNAYSFSRVISSITHGYEGRVAHTRGHAKCVQF